MISTTNSEVRVIIKGNIASHARKTEWNLSMQTIWVVSICLEFKKKAKISKMVAIAKQDLIWLNFIKETYTGDQK